MKLLKQVAAMAIQLDDAISPTIEQVSETAESAFDSALAKAREKFNITEAPEGDIDVAGEMADDAPTATGDSSDKGQYGSRQVEFKQDVYRIPENPTGDVSQPVGLLTQSDLSNYVLFKKGDRLSFKWVSGDSGTAEYEAVRNGDVSVDADIVWTDALIRELEDEGAISLMAAQ